MNEAPVDDILVVTSRWFSWNAADGFAYRSGSEQTHGLNRTREGAQARIESHRTRLDARHAAFLGTLFDAAEMATITQAFIRHENGATVVSGRRFEITPADIGA